MTGLDREYLRRIGWGDASSLKRIAWAYGCAKKGSDEERQLEKILRERIESERAP